MHESYRKSSELQTLFALYFLAILNIATIVTIIVCTIENAINR